MSKAKMCASALLCLALLTACEKTPPPVAIADRTALCRDWKHTTISKKDVLTDQTATQIEAGNKSRPNWGCEYGRDEAKAG